MTIGVMAVMKINAESIGSAAYAIGASRRSALSALMLQLALASAWRWQRSVQRNGVVAG